MLLWRVHWSSDFMCFCSISGRKLLRLKDRSTWTKPSVRTAVSTSRRRTYRWSSIKWYLDGSSSLHSVDKPSWVQIINLFLPLLPEKGEAGFREASDGAAAGQRAGAPAAPIRDGDEPRWYSYFHELWHNRKCLWRSYWTKSVNNVAANAFCIIHLLNNITF